MLKENGYQESAINKSFEIIINIHGLPRSQQQKQAINTQEEAILMSIKLPNTLWTHKMRSTFYTVSTLFKLPSKPRFWVFIEDKNKYFLKLTLLAVK